MFGDRDREELVELAGTWSMPNDWQVVIRAEWVDVSAGRPHGLSYALILQDEEKERLLGFDNSHAPDGGADGDPFDHEHRASAPGQTFPYKFISAGQLISDFFDRCGAYCALQGVKFEFDVEDVP
jgi:Family of unknown function (DUF6516)